jgi:RNA polymerase sigma-70 factor (ECF subfamily)
MSTPVNDQQGTFQQIAEQHGKALQLHCYRMTGSLHDAEDLVQETFLRAWRGLERFEGRASMRNWLYRIATNACLNALARRKIARRVLPESQSAPASDMPSAKPAFEVAWLEPYPDTALEDIADSAPGPDARYELREAVQLAFMAALQHLPARQRAVILLRDVLGWSAHETAEALETSVAAVNSILQRARATLEKHQAHAKPRVHATVADSQRTLLDAYLRAWQSCDVDAFAALLIDDAILSMPPWPLWYRGRHTIASFFAWTHRPGGHGPFRLLPTAANGQPAFAFYSRADSAWRAHSIQLLTIEDSSISQMTSFVDASLFDAFGCPQELK